MQRLDSVKKGTIVLVQETRRRTQQQESVVEVIIVHKDHLLKQPVLQVNMGLF